MNGQPSLDRILAEWFESEAITRAPDRLFDRVFAATSGAPQARRRVGWLLDPTGLVVGRRIANLMLVALLTVALTVGALVAGSLRPPDRPPANVAVVPRVVATTPFGSPCSHPTGLLVVGDAVWVSCLDQVRRFDATTGQVNGAVNASLIAADPSGAWAATAAGVEPLDPATARPLDSVPVPGAVGIGLDATSVWVAQGDARSVTRLSRTTHLIEATIALAGRPGAIAVGEGAVWVTLPDQGQIVRIDPSVNAVAARIPILNPAVITVANGRAWVLDVGATTLTLVASTGLVESRPFAPLAGHVSPSEPATGAAGGFVVTGTSVWEVAGSQVIETDEATGAVVRILVIGNPTGVALIGVGETGSRLLVVDAVGPRVLALSP